MPLQTVYEQCCRILGSTCVFDAFFVSYKSVNPRSGLDEGIRWHTLYRIMYV